METPPIRCEQDYDAALAEAERLMEAVPGTPEGDRLDILVTLIEAYEGKHWSIGSSDPTHSTASRSA